MTRAEFISRLEESEKVDYLTYMQDRTIVLVMTKDEDLVASLKARGARARWYDRTEFSTQKGEPPNRQCEVLLTADFQWEVAA